MNGIVKTINREKGFGFIRDAKGKEYFFHRSAIKTIRFDDLEMNQEVTFEEVESSKGPRAEDVFPA